MDVAIRRASLDDARALAALLHALGQFERIQREALDTTVVNTQASLSHSLADDSHLVLVAQAASGDVIGYCAVHWLPYLFLGAPEGYISELFIHPDWRGRGVGGRLLQTVHAQAVQRGCSRLNLLNMRTRESYQRQFYSKHGWEERPDAVNFILRLT